MLIQLMKVDADKRLIFARIDETPDSAGEIMDYATSKPEFQKWSETMRKASGGASLGNLRAMHQLVAAGAVRAIDYDDAGKSISFTAEVVDDAELKKVAAGVYTGISPGGQKKIIGYEGANRRYTAFPGEISLVDVPCKPEATFTMLKAGGAEEQVPFKAPSPEAALIEELAKVSSIADYRGIVLAQPAAMIKAMFATEEMRAVVTAKGLAKRDISEEERKKLAKDGKALEDGSYPIENKEDLEDAIRAYGRAKDKEATKALIIKRAKALDATDLLPEDWEGSTKKKMEKVLAIGNLRKGLFDVSNFAVLIDSLTGLAQSVTFDATVERDGSPLPGRLSAWLTEGVALFQELATEETREALTALHAAVEAIPPAAREGAEALAKRGARHSKTDLGRVQAIHDHARDLGAECGAEEMAKIAGAGAALAPMAKVALDLAETRQTLKKVSGELDLAKRRVAELEREPQPGGPRLKAVGRGDDIGQQPDAEAGTKRLAEIEAMPEGREKTAQLVRHAMEFPALPR